MIIGKLIPAGTGLKRYRAVRPLATEVPEQVMTTELLDQFGDTDYYEADEGRTMGQGVY